MVFWSPPIKILSQVSFWFKNKLIPYWRISYARLGSMSLPPTDGKIILLPVWECFTLYSLWTTFLVDKLFLIVWCVIWKSAYRKVPTSIVLSFEGELWASMHSLVLCSSESLLSSANTFEVSLKINLDRHSVNLFLTLVPWLFKYISSKLVSLGILSFSQ